MNEIYIKYEYKSLTDGTTTKHWASKFLVAMEIITNNCWDQFFGTLSMFYRFREIVTNL